MTTRGEQQATRDKRRINVATARLASFLPHPHWLLDELTATLSWLRERELWAILLISLVLWLGAYQWPYQHQLDLGGDPLSHQRGYDVPYLQGSFNESEPSPPSGQEWWQETQQPYRWTKADSIISLPGIGGSFWITSIRAMGQPTTGSTTSHWSDGTTTAEIHLGRLPRIYKILVRADGNGDLVLHLTTSPYQSGSNGDRRSLGFVAYRTVFIPTIGAHLPALPQFAMLGVTLVLAYGLARRVISARRVTFICGLLSSIGLALLLMYARLAVTIFTPTLLALALACYGLALMLLHIPLPRHQAPSGTPERKLAGTRMYLPPSVVGLIVLAFALRLGGILHPYVIFSDLLFHAHNLRAFIATERAGTYLTSTLPNNAGGGSVPYPPGQYITLAPGQLLLPVDDNGRALLIKVGNALLDSLIVGLVWYALWRAGVGSRASLLGAALYLTPSPILKSFSIGEFANIFGQGMALPALILLGTEARHLARKRTFIFALALLSLALLGHLGVTISLALLLICLTLLWLVARGAHFPVGALMLLSVLAASLVGMFYYSFFTGLLAQRLLGSTDGSAPTVLHDPLARIIGIGISLGRIDVPLTPLMLLLGALGIIILACSSSATLNRPARKALWLLLLAWWSSTLLSLAPLLLRDQTVRWELFLYPSLCIGGGPALKALSSRGRAGQLLATFVVVFLLWRGIDLWIAQLADFLH